MLSTCRLASARTSSMILLSSRSLYLPAKKVAPSASKTVQQAVTRRHFSSNSSSTKSKTGWWHSVEVWGGLGALAGWGMSLSAIWDAMNNGPEVISLTMTPVLIVYSSLFARWAWIVQPPNMLLCGCHVANIMAQLNQLRRAIEYKLNNGQEDEAKKIMQQAGIGGALLAGTIVAAPTVRNILTRGDYGVVTKFAASPAGPFTVHFWAPMSKWMISGASFFDLQRPTEKISLPQYTALTATGFFFSRYALLVTPINYALCSVNLALFGSSAWHLSRKVNADYLHIGMDDVIAAAAANKE